MKVNKLAKVINSLVVVATLLVLAGTTASSHISAFSPKVKSSDQNLVLTMPQKIVSNQPLNITAESAIKGPLSSKISEITYSWNIDVCGYKKKLTTKLSQNSTAYRHSIKGVYKQGCKVKVELNTAVIYSPTGARLPKAVWLNPIPGDGVVYPSIIDGKLNLTSDIILAGPSKVKVGNTGIYNTSYKLSPNQKTIWFGGYMCNVLKKGFNPETNPYDKASFTWKPTKVQNCNAESLAVYTSTNNNGIVSDIEYAVKKMPVSSYK